MKKTLKLKTVLMSMALAGSAAMAVAPATSHAGVSANAGFVTDYIFRGFNQQEDTPSPALQGGLDYEHDSGLFAGVWGSTMEHGAEYDLYAGWGGNFGGVDLGAAYTSYSYTDKKIYGGKAGAFEEINLSTGFGPLSATYDLGQDNTVESTAEDKYVHYSVSLDAGAVAEGVSLTYGETKYDKADAAAYFDIGYSTEVEGFDFGANVIMSGANTNDTTYFVVGLSKSFDLM
ncbi:TorF family putative porin [Thiomicrorhabdus aquaedulcis]|uniref:TorF family putative porin n=1 Tax=Thiomicrorhabdus aquaedulcis TaxID=2211106 RepID=UPI000FD72507|nr:TorF family putative porin [Thiomicrorhabdus aquaedulcis]